MKTILLGAAVFSWQGFAGAAGLGPEHAQSQSVPNASTREFHAPDSLTVMFFAKVFALPSADSPLMGVAEDGSRWPVLQSRPGWTQIGFKRTMGWIQAGPKKPEEKSEGKAGVKIAAAQRDAGAEAGTASGRAWGGNASRPVGKSFSQPLLITLASGSVMLGILIWALAYHGYRRGRLRAAARAADFAARAESKVSALEGRILPNGLSEILQFLETGRRTGMLSVEDGVPIGIINFHNGQITFAQTRQRDGKEAVMEILSLTAGSFRFFEDKRVAAVNCRLSPLDVLLQHAHRMDEFQNQSLRAAS